MDNSDPKEIYLNKKQGYNYIQFSFDDHSEVPFEPKTDIWDLIFTQYTTLLITDEGEPFPYLVTGVLINEAGTSVSFDSTLVFNEVLLEDVLYLDYKTDFDVIGYTWKKLHGDVNSGDFYYKANTNYNYFIKSKIPLNSMGFFYLKFLSFLVISKTCSKIRCSFSSTSSFLRFITKFAVSLALSIW